MLLFSCEKQTRHIHNILVKKTFINSLKSTYKLVNPRSLLSKIIPGRTPNKAPLQSIQDPQLHITVLICSMLCHPKLLVTVVRTTGYWHQIRRYYVFVQSCTVNIMRYCTDVIERYAYLLVKLQILFRLKRPKHNCLC